MFLFAVLIKTTFCKITFFSIRFLVVAFRFWFHFFFVGVCTFKSDLKKRRCSKFQRFAVFRFGIRLPFFMCGRLFLIDFVAKLGTFILLHKLFSTFFLLFLKKVCFCGVLVHLISLLCFFWVLFNGFSCAFYGAVKLWVICANCTRVHYLSKKND